MGQAAKKKDRQMIAQSLGMAFLDAIEFLNSGRKSRLTPLDEFLDKTSPMEKHLAIGRRLSEKRQSLEMSQESVAESLRISQPEYSRIETGGKRLSIIKAEKLAALFKCSVPWILTGK